MSINLGVMQYVLHGGFSMTHSFQVAADCNMMPSVMHEGPRESCLGARQPSKVSHTLVNSAEQQGPTLIIYGSQIVWSSLMNI